MLLKDTSDSHCVYKVNDAVVGSFLFATVGVTVRRQELHRGFSVGIISHCLLLLYTYHILFVLYLFVLYTYHILFVHLL